MMRNSSYSATVRAGIHFCSTWMRQADSARKNAESRDAFDVGRGRQIGVVGSLAKSW